MMNKSIRIFTILGTTTKSWSNPNKFAFLASCQPRYFSARTTDPSATPDPSTSVKNGGPLQGIRVLDLTRILAGPFCAMILGDLGAEVIKVEKPGSGDDTRHWGPPIEKDISCYFLCANRNKKSIAVDFRTGGVKILQELAKRADVLLENYVPGTLEKFGLGYEDLKKINPGLVYCSITGYGPDGPYRTRGGYDIIAASLGGLMHITGPKDGDPCKVGVAMTDIATGLYAHGAVMAALLARHQTGKGQKIDCNLLSTQVSCLANLGSNYLNSGIEARKWGTEHESIVPYESFKTKDGWITLGAGNNTLFGELCTAINKPDLSTNPKYATNDLRVTNRVELLGILRSVLETKTAEEWNSIFKNCKFPFGVINDMQKSFNDPQVQHNKMVREMGRYKMIGPAVKFSSSRNEPRIPPPSLGQHTREVLQNLEFTDLEIDQLYKNSVVQ